jgi:hypothetical protein
MRDKGDHYEYVAVYVDNIVIVSKDPQAIVDDLKGKHEFKLKGTGEIEYHLGCDYFRDENGVLCFAPRRYIERMIGAYEQMFGEKPKQWKSPLEENDHPELDMTELLDADDAKKFQSLLGEMQWAIQLGRLDITTAVSTMSGFRAAPRKGHLERAKRMVGWLSKMRDLTIRFRTDEPDFSDVEDEEYDWERSVYGNVKEEIPEDAPRPLGKAVITSTFYDANMYHNLLTGRAMTGILHFLNQTPIDWYSKRQSTVQSATYGTEFVAARTGTEQATDLRITLRYLGVPVKGPSYLFGDNESVVKSSTLPGSRLKLRHVALSYHKVREAIASKAIRMIWIEGKENPADILTKHWSYSSVWKRLKTLMSWAGDTMDILDDDETKGKDGGKPSQTGSDHG